MRLAYIAPARRALALEEEGRPQPLSALGSGERRVDVRQQELLAAAHRARRPHDDAAVGVDLPVAVVAGAIVVEQLT